MDPGETDPEGDFCGAPAGLPVATRAWRGGWADGVDGTDAGGYHLPVNCLPPTLGRSGLVHLAPLETDIDRCETHVLAHRGAPGKPQPGTFG